MKKKLTGFLALLLAAVLLFPAVPAGAASAPKLNVAKKTITGIGKKATLTVSGLPSGASTVWASSNKAVATVAKVTNKKATVTAKKKGTATITAIIKQGSKVSKKLTCKVTIKAGSVPATGIKITNAKLDSGLNAQVIQMGTTYDFNRRLISSVKGVASTDKSYWFVEDTTIATVKSNGVVTPLKEGSTYLVVCCGKNKTEAMENYNNATKYDKIKITVAYPQLSFTHSLIGSTRLKLTFNQAIKTETLVGSEGKLTENIKLTPKITDGKAASSLGDLKGSFDESKKVLTIETNKRFDGEYDLSLTNKVVSESGTPLKAITLALTLKDVTGPSYAGASTDDSGVIAVIKFNEPIDIEYLRPANPKQGTVDLPYSALAYKESYQLSEDKQSLTIDLSSLAGYNKQETYTVDLYGIRDLAGNISNPYPLTVQLYTDTTPKSQAVCKGIRRSGNSLVATFDKAIQSPGYAEVKGFYLSGTVNQSNKKEVIYSLSGTGLTTATGAISVKLTGFSSYNVASSSRDTTYTSMVNFSSKSALFNITTKSLSTDSSNRVILKLTYDAEITLLTSSGNLNVSSNINGIIGAPASYSYKAQASGKTVTITFTSGSFTESGIYTFTIPDGFIMDSYGNLNRAAAVSVTKTTGSSLSLPAPSSILMDYDNRSIVYVTFDTMLDVSSAVNVSNYSIAGLTVSSATLIANSPGCPAVVQLVIGGSEGVGEGIPYPVRISGLKGYMGSYGTMDTYNEMVILSNKKTLPIYGKNASSSNDTITMTLQNRGTGHISYTFTANGKTLVPNNTTSSGNQIIFTFADNTLTKGMQVTVSPAADNVVIDANGNQVLNLPFTITVQ